jgi:hypothetical protein
MDTQIVNGLQTSREIFNHYRGLQGDAVQTALESDGRSVLVRVLIIGDPAAQDAVIKATNSQNRMMPASLRMTDQIHRDIEELLKSYDLYYDRRKGFYRDQARPIKKIITVNSLAQAMISIILQKPDDARARPGDYFKDQRRYEQIFGRKLQLPVYVRCISILRRVERFLEASHVRGADAKNIKFHMATDLSCELTKTNRPWAAKLLDIPDPSAVDNSVLAECYSRVNQIYEDLGKTTEKDAVAKGTDFVTRLLGGIKERFPSVKRIRIA